MNQRLLTWGEEGAPPVLLLHCSLAHGGAWKRVARRLADRAHLVAPDLVGHGEGPPGDPARDYHDQVTDQARALLTERPAHVVGHSFGATVALRLAIEAPERVASLTMIEPVLFAAAPDSPGKRANARTLSRMGPMIARGETREAARQFLSVWGGGEPFDEMPADQAAYMADRMWVVAAQHAALHHDAARLLPRLGRVRCPSLLLEGSTSPPVIGRILDTLERGLADTRRLSIEGAGHMAPITHAAEVAAAIGGLLDRVRV
ncbi:alpha/beta fold hydrolase [Roseibacterium sp. SDUM158017]|uniref:alpha/beta fold hydrolase n=1 Tax=Roseicyclus salinarum TaxID=3036773 RepID=UPI0024152926|nr:alpha/beta fold hydrolase [Roseibacterium sp. SDUM158017]MDG4648300.1 alpha/beta fold hydrolase [Roseibacterium sp. SDUM158017]